MQYGFLVKMPTWNCFICEMVQYQTINHVCNYCEAALALKMCQALKIARKKVKLLDKAYKLRLSAMWLGENANLGTVLYVK